MSVPSPITGHCLCGAVNYSVAGAPMAVILCHCEDCRRQSGAAYSVNLVVAQKALTLDEARTKTYNTVGADTGQTRDRVFCPECGSPILTRLHEAPGIAVIKAGTLDDPSWLEPQMEIFTDSAHPWVHNADAPERGQFPRSLPS
jgi:hypothetical protein